MRLYEEFFNDTFALPIERERYEINLKKFDAVTLTKRNQLYRIADDDFDILDYTIGVDFRSYLYKSIEKLIQECHQHGIMEYFKSRTFKSSLVGRIDIVSEPKVLTMYMLSAGFYVWLVTVVIACFIFIMEQIIFSITQRSRKVH